MLDRTWYNSLVDDDGSGMTGSVWDKADVDALMDAIDAELNRTDATQAAGTWTPVLIGAGGGTATYAFQAANWARSGNLIQIGGRITLSSKGSLAGTLSISTLPFATYPNAAVAIGTAYFSGIQAGFSPILHINPGATRMELYAGWGQALATAVDATHITGAFDLIFGGAYRRN